MYSSRNQPPPQLHVSINFSSLFWQENLTILYGLCHLLPISSFDSCSITGAPLLSLLFHHSTFSYVLFLGVRTRFHFISVHFLPKWCSQRTCCHLWALSDDVSLDSRGAYCAPETRRVSYCLSSSLILLLVQFGDFSNVTECVHVLDIHNVSSHTGVDVLPVSPFIFQFMLMDFYNAMTW